MAAASFDRDTEAQARFSESLDAAAQGRAATVRREHFRAAVVDAERLRRALATLSPSPRLVAEQGGWSAFVPGLPVASDGADLNEAVEELAQARREYVEDWEERLWSAPDHADHWGVVQLVNLSDDDQLRAWITATRP